MHRLWIALRREKGQIPCAFGLRCDESRTRHLSHYFIQACWLMLPAARQTQACDVYCITGCILHVHANINSRSGEWCFVLCHNSCLHLQLLFIQQERKRYHQISVTNLQLTCSTWSGVQSCLGKSMFPRTPASERTLYLSSSHQSIEQQPCALHVPAQCPEVTD